MSENKSVTYSVGPGVGTLLGVLFVALKLTHVIAWPWVWVLAPFWIGLAVAILILIVFLGIALIAVSLGAYAANRARKRVNAQIDALRELRKKSSY